MSFLIENWYLLVLALVSGIGLALPVLRGGAGLGLQPQAAVQRINRDKAVVVDVREAEEYAAGQLLKAEGFEFDVAYTSVLKRAIHTLQYALDAMDSTWLPVVKDWRLNERHYGGLQGLNKAETAQQYGAEQVLVWRRSYDTPPPALEAGDPRSERGDRRYAKLEPAQIPLTECLKDTVARVVPFWQEVLAPRIQSGERIVIAAHGNSIRALVKYLDNIADDAIVGVNIPNGIPLVYELDAQLQPIRSYYLGDAEAAAKAAAAVAAQGKA